MTEEKMSPLRQRMIEDMRSRGMGDIAQKSHIRAIKDFAAFLGRSPGTATPEDLRAYQLHITDAGVTPSTFNTRIVALRLFFGMTCGREEKKRYTQFRIEPREPPVVFSVEEVSDILMAAPGPWLKYRAALSIGYGAGLRAVEICSLKIGDIVPEARLRHDGLGADPSFPHPHGRPGRWPVTRRYKVGRLQPRLLPDCAGPARASAQRAAANRNSPIHHRPNRLLCGLL